ncbi:MAG: FAD-dependent oxidoreductase, partial [Roseitalea porphyridii]
GAKTHWPDGLDWQVDDANPAPGWLADASMPHGVNHDTLSARLDPRGLVAALRAVLEGDGHVTIAETTAVSGVARDGSLALSDGRTITPGATIIAAGTGAFPLIDPDDPARIGRGVKGQGALLRPRNPLDPDRPILYDKGTYVIAHESGLVAVGSTSEDGFDAPDTTDRKLDALLDTARELCPALAGAGIVERWAGVRPRAAGREPLIGPLPGYANTIVATGGFKITFAIAHLMADAAVGFALGEAPSIPAIFRPEHRLAPTE